MNTKLHYTVESPHARCFVIIQLVVSLGFIILSCVFEGCDCTSHPLF